MTEPSFEPREPRRAELREAMERIGAKIYLNLMDSDLARRIVAASDHATQPEPGQPFPYDRIAFDREVGDTLYIIARLDCRAGVGGSIQPVQPKLDRLERDPAERQALANRIWEGVTDDERRVAVRWAIHDLREKYEAQRGGTAALRGRKLSDEEADRWIRQANEKLDLLQRFADALERDGLTIAPEPEYADLKVTLPEAPTGR